jgi:hypothetical protein
MYVLVFCFFIIPAAFIVKAQSVMRITASTEVPSVDSVSTTAWSHLNIMNTFASIERTSLETALVGSDKNLVSSRNQIVSNIFKSTDFQAPLTSLYAALLQETSSKK